MEELATGEVKVIDEETEERARIYTGKYGGRDFVLIFVINGLDDIRTGKHSIEDHLPKAADEMLSILEILRIPKRLGNPSTITYS